MSDIVVAALYQFVTLEDYHELREPLLDACLAAAYPGYPAAGAARELTALSPAAREAIDQVLAYLRSDPRMGNLQHKESVDQQMPFYRMKVKLKREIVTMGIAGIDPNQRVGTYVAPRDWNELVNDPEVLLIDTRNDYEYGIGTFRGALDPQTTTTSAISPGMCAST